MRKGAFILRMLGILIVFGLPATAPAQGQQSAEELAKKLANPVASMISFPLQNNFDINYRSTVLDGGFKYTLNIQPVVPFSLNKDWNLISRTILPLAQQSNVFGVGSTQTGLGDTLQSFFFSPASPSKKLGLIWGVGPAILLPTGTDEFLGGGKWGIGPTFVIVKQTGSWTIGLLCNHVWSFAGKAERSDISNTYLQPFLTRTYKGGFSWNLNTEFTGNWIGDAVSGSINAVVGQIFQVFGHQVQVSMGPKIWYGDAAVRARWGIRANVSFVFPKK